MFSKWSSTGTRLQATVLLLLAFTVLSGCGNSEDADKIRAIVDINTRNVTGIDVTSENTVIETGATEQFTASGIVDEGNQPAIDATNNVNWVSSDPAIASINQAGLLSSHSDGMVTITARWADLSATKDLMLSSAALESITVVDNASPVSVCSTGHQLSALGNYADATTRNISELVSWASADDSLLEIDENGRFTAFGSGTVDVTATRNSISGTRPISIANNLSSISISAPATDVAVNDTLSFTATATYDDSSTGDITRIASWQSDNTAVLSISNETSTKGVATGVAEGGANVSANCNISAAVTSDVRPITVSPEVVINGVSINEDAVSLEFKVIDSPEQLVAKLKRSNDTYFTDVTDDDDTIWRIERVIEGEGVKLSNTKGSKGEITFTAPGITEISVRYNDNDNRIGPFEDRIEIEVIE
jgi:hypothetical protein